MNLPSLGTLMAGNLSNSTTWTEGDEEAKQLVQDMFKVDV